MRKSERLPCGSAAYLDSLYGRYRNDPNAVDPSFTELFRALEEEAPAAPPAGASPVIGVFDLVHSYRELGHLIAALNPLGGNAESHPLLALKEFGFADQDLDRRFACGNFKGCATATLRELLDALRLTYCGTLGVEYGDLPEKEEREWLQDRMEPGFNRPNVTTDERRHILELLIAAEGFEQFLQAKYPTQKRFSLEGGEALVPLLDTIIEAGAPLGVREIVLGMAHRGRLNVLANVLRKPVEMILSEFEGTGLPADMQGDGDVKYHLGYSNDHTTRDGHRVHLSLSANPSHLEMINPIIEGIVRAKQVHLRDEERQRVVPLLIHGDAAFTGEGIVPETLMLSGLEAYRTGGTIHVILNNQIGFTTSPERCRSTPYASDVAKMIRVPVFHVNGDDPEAAVHAARLAAGFRQRFKKDVIIDLICYRRHGHNELDDPSFTQPVMYKRIGSHPTVRKQYAEKLLRARQISTADAEEIARDQREVLDAALQYSREFRPRQQVFAFGGLWKGLGWAGEDWDAHTAVEGTTLERVAAAFGKAPVGFDIHPKLERLMQARAQMVSPEGRIDWGCAEALAIGTLLLEERNVRLSGQDSARGTFSHRHAVWRDRETDEPYVPLNHLDPKQGHFEVVDSPLSEAAVLGFEYGMSLGDPHRLVMWEAQFGDFVNVAQVFIDQFIAGSESKWHRTSGVVLLLPHGYEGQGPEHSSARLERFLQLCAEDNMQVCYPTTPAQFFHALRRQMHRRFRKPLVVMSPKSLLRHPLATSVLDDFTSGGFRNVLDEVDPAAPDDVRRILLCSGKVYYALLAARRKREGPGPALLRLEQLYPFPKKELAAVLGRYGAAREVFWVQEEPRNMGAWFFVREHLPALLGEGQTLTYVGRDEAASPATGVYAVHELEEAEIVSQALSTDDGTGKTAPAEMAAAPRAAAK